MVELANDQLLWIYQRMRLIREFEDRAAYLFAAGKLPGALHLYAGEEAIAVGVCTLLTERDHITSTHRGHGHCIAKGLETGVMMAELYGKASGICKGKGGSMHIADVDKGMLGANGIVGAGGPLACGAGLTAKVKGTDQVSVCFFGDGAAEQGTMHESMNLASIWKLPVIFVCENNGYAQTTPLRYHCAASNIVDRAKAYCMPGLEVDGTDVFAVYDAAAEAIARARRGDGPTLLECKAPRYYGHFQGDNLSYYADEEKTRLGTRDPLDRFTKRVMRSKLLSRADLVEADAHAKQMVDEAVEFAERSSYPTSDEVVTDVYVSY
jgi:acetoin:2,6-dichlorophenolindophenol oxidoreductase subunit alpha